MTEDKTNENLRTICDFETAVTCCFCNIVYPVSIIRNVVTVNETVCCTEKPDYSVIHHCNTLNIQEFPQSVSVLPLSNS